MSADEKPEAGGRGVRSLLLAILPLAVFLALAGIFYKQLAAGGGSMDIPSALVGKPAPATTLEPLAGLLENGEQVPALTPEVLSGEYTLVNIWASWCAPCRLEHPLLVALGQSGELRIAGLNYKDSRENALRFLGQLGNPYHAVGIDPNGRAAIEWGVYGVPETFLVGPDGTILHKHVGPLTAEVLETAILPLVRDGEAAPGS